MPDVLLLVELRAEDYQDMNVCRISIFAILLFVLNSISAQVAPIKYLSIDQGLSNNSIRCIYQDHNGFMWFGTYDGLDRYDGYNFKVFRNKIGDSASLPHNYINTISEDLHGNLYVGTGQGLSIYNNLTSSFLTGMYVPFGSNRRERIPYNVRAVLTDAKGNIYIGTSGGGLLIKKEGSYTIVQATCAKSEKGECMNQVESMVIDNQQNVWVSIADAGLYQYNSVKQSLELVSSFHISIRSMQADATGNIWAGTADGLYQYRIASHTMVHFSDLQTPEKLTSNSVFSLALDEYKNLWIGTEGGGIDILHTHSGKINYLLPGDGLNNLSSETVYSIFIDKESRKWIGTHKGGINIISPQKRVFQTIAHNPLNANSLISNFISSFHYDKSDNLWIGTDGGGISVWNRQANTFTNYRHDAGKPQSLSNNAVPDILEDYTGNIWIATYGDGINKFDRTKGTFEHYKCINSETNAENNYVWRLYEDRQHNLWATTYSAGLLYKFNREANRFEMFSTEVSDIFCLTEDRDGVLWGGNAYGLCKIDKVNKRYTYYQINKPVRAVFEDKVGRFWLGTEGRGLILFDRAKGKVVSNYNDSDGLCNNSVLNILSDDKNNLWLSTFHGLSKFDPVSKKFSNFYQEDGLQSNQFEYNAALKLPGGEMVFGGIGGFTLFSPNNLVIESSMPPVFLTSILVNNQVVTQSSRYVAEVKGNLFQKLVVPYNDAVLSFDFAALEYAAPGKINYAYYLEGWDKSWIYTSNIRTASYTNIREGNYTLHIKATNAAGIWNPKEVQLQLVVLPPWYRSWWAYLIYAILVAAFIYLYNRYRVRKANLETEVKLAQIRSEKERELAQLEIKKEKELAEKKLTFFTDVSHEFRTPLTLIINPLKDYLENEKQQDKKELNVVYRNARRLLTLVDQLLQFRKAGTDTDSLRLVKLNFCRLCRDVWASFEKAAALKRINYQFYCPNENLELYADREKMEVILYNLLSNALKFTPEEGEIAMSLVENDNAVEVKLTDNGQGIPTEVGNKLFERFYQVQEKGTTGKPGFGIGLYLVKHFVEKHRGEVSYDSTTGLGTTFCVSFQKGLNHFENLPIYEDVVEKTSLPEDVIHAEIITNEPENNGLEELVSSQKTILIVEDNEQIREYVSGIFAGEFVVYQAASGNEGIATAKKMLPDIIISDIMMEGGNGIDLCNTLKNDPALGHIPIILLTAVSDNELRLKGTESGADDYITKPFEKDLLVARVHALLKNRTKLQQYFFDEVTLKKHDFKISAEYKEFLDACIAIIEKHLEDDAFNIKKLSQEIGMSHSVLYRKVKSVSGQSIAGFIRFIRLRKAAELMINTSGNVNEIAFQVGINDIKYFRKQFNALFGMNPSEYIKKYRPSFTPTFTIKGEKNN